MGFNVYVRGIGKLNKLFESYQNYFEYCDEPLNYKGILIEPMTMRNYREFKFISYCLEFEPSELNDISMIPYKKYTFLMKINQRLLNDEVPPENYNTYVNLASSFKGFKQIVFKNYNFLAMDINHENRKKSFTLIPKEITESDPPYIVVSEKEFEELYRLFLFQNGTDVSYKDEYPLNIRMEADKLITLTNKLSKTKPVSLEKQIDLCASIFGGDYNKVKELPIRKFFNLNSNLLERETYNSSLNGMIIAGSSIPHWFSGDYTKNPYEGIIQTEKQAMEQVKGI